LALRLSLPQSWTKERKRLEQAGVPEPFQEVKTKGQIALELLDQGRGEGLPGRVVLADAGYGVSEDFRNGLAGRELSYIVGVTEEMVVFAERPRWVAPAVTTRGHPQTRPHLADDSARPISLKERAVRAPRRRVTWREGSQQTLSARFAWVRVWPGQGWADGEEAHVRLQQPAGGHPAGPRGAAVEESLAGGAGLPADEGGVGPGSFRGPLVARVSSPCLPGDAGVWFLGPGTTASETAPGDAGEQSDWIESQARPRRRPANRGSQLSASAPIPPARADWSGPPPWL
jgi:hypothetical protein